MKILPHLIACTIASIISAGCGGGGTSTPAAATAPVAAPIIASNAVPSANAGLDQALPVGVVATFDGGASSDANGDALTYAWRLTGQPAGSKAVLSSMSVVRPQIALDVEGIFTAALTVNDGKSESAIDSVSITATKPVVAAKVPLANAGSNQNVLVGATVALNGTASDSQNSNALSYRWVFLSKPSATATLNSITASRPTFVADVAGTYLVGLVVNNALFDSPMSTVVVTALPLPTAVNVAPVANAGADQLVKTGATVLLDAALSKDANGDRLSYTWTLAAKPALSTAVLGTSTLSTATFRADLSGNYDVRLSVNDGKLDSVSSDLISIVAVSTTAAVIADTGAYRCANLTKDQALSLYAAGHDYLDRDHDGKPCEANDLLNEQASPYVPPAPATSGKCWVKGYTRKNGTHVNGYYRSC